ncbi:hypothetical protein Pfo_005391 [Paulownia fortunei]|nr:hypothetical protein Pfo_005391 [Paulownia fortunei]
MLVLLEILGRYLGYLPKKIKGCECATVNGPRSRDPVRQGRTTHDGIIIRFGLGGSRGCFADKRGNLTCPLSPIKGKGRMILNVDVIADERPILWDDALHEAESYTSKQHRHRGMVRSHPDLTKKVLK